MPATYQPLATTTLGSAAATIEFANIPGTYTDLVFICQLASTSDNHIFVRFNGDSASNYSATRLSGSGTTAVSDRYTSQTVAPLSSYGYPSSTLGDTVSIMHIMDYSNTTTNKTYLARSNRASIGVDAVVGLWRQTSAITTVTFATTIFGTSNSILANSTITMYGVKAG